MSKILFVFIFLLSVSVYGQKDRELITDKGENKIVHSPYLEKARAQLFQNEHVKAGIKSKNLFQPCQPHTSFKERNIKANVLAIQNKASRVTASVVRLESPTDSLRQKLDTTIQSVQEKTTGKVTDVANDLAGKIKAPVDSIQQKVNSSIQSVQDKTTGKVTGGANNIAAKVKSPVEGLDQKVNGKVQSLQNGVKLPDGKLPDVKSPLNSGAADLNLQGNPIQTGGDLNLPGNTINTGTNMPVIPGADTKLNTGNTQGITPDVDTSLPNMNTGTPGINTNVPEVKIPQAGELPGMKEVNQVGAQVTAVSGAAGQAGKIQEDIKNVKAGKLDEVKTIPKELENKALNIEQAGKLKAEADKMKLQQDQYAALIQKYKDKKRLQEEMKSKASMVANEELGKHTVVVKDAQQQMAKARRTYGNFQSLKDLPKKRPNEMKDKPFYERLVPGINLQVYQSNHLVMDIAPSVGYRPSGRWTTGASYTFRVGFDKNYSNYIRNEQVYGPRVYTQFGVAKGFFLHVDAEALHPAALDVAQEYNSSTVYASYFGIGKSVSITRKISGNIIGLYRVEYQGTLPSQSKFNIRIGFNLVTKKVQRLVLR